ncbi:hypothetical protein GCM10011505_49450 [Tistrella bauzanensis]|uniref:Uncharacterized protein n=1 Tax=Tistrella bauzanensis TaxID=657419 RepID=A0ABQ1J8V1_9PROT|nr:hypothetical protein GCM10011505_49450 [Tistrella bauzanensis]
MIHLKNSSTCQRALVERADGGCRQGEVVGQEHQRLSGLGVFETNTAQMFGVDLAADDISQITYASFIHNNSPV